ncbi:hypothetical protein RDI58_019886 [Solanum bulbocastanum]|uniref:Uncharacterized protein n=1 Tax=Solanum bulbocastanum TaxID=147425 RepID=A0AAN8T5J3_SOLBU
MKLEKGAKC